MSKNKNPKNFGSREELSKFKASNGPEAPLDALEALKDNVAFQEVMKTIEAKLDVLKDRIINERKIDKIRLMQGRCSEDIEFLNILDILIDEKKAQLNKKESNDAR